MQPHEEWLFKAEHDLKSAEILFGALEPMLDIAIYHTQQCAEKALKAYLVSTGQPVDKTHNLALLVERCEIMDKHFNDVIEEALFLRPFATLYRYPEGDLEPSKPEVASAIVASKKILDLVSELLRS